MTKAIKIVIIIIAVAVIAAGIFAVIYSRFYGEQASPTNAAAANANASNAVSPANTNAATNATNTATSASNAAASTNDANAQPEFSEEESVLRLARLFLERYGSFSNRNNYENINNVQSLMTKKFQQESDKVIAAGQTENNVEAEYYGITTKALSVRMQNFAANSAVVLISTQRAETKGANDPNIFTQDAEVALEKANGSWKISSVTWK